MNCQILASICDNMRVELVRQIKINESLKSTLLPSLKNSENTTSSRGSQLEDRGNHQNFEIGYIDGKLQVSNKP